MNRAAISYDIPVYLCHFMQYCVMLNSMTPKLFGEKTKKFALPLKLTHCALAEGWNAAFSFNA